MLQMNPDSLKINNDPDNDLPIDSYDSKKQKHQRIQVICGVSVD